MWGLHFLSSKSLRLVISPSTYLITSHHFTETADWVDLLGHKAGLVQTCPRNTQWRRKRTSWYPESIRSKIWVRCECRVRVTPHMINPTNQVRAGWAPTNVCYIEGLNTPHSLFRCFSVLSNIIHTLREASETNSGLTSVKDISCRWATQGSNHRPSDEQMTCASFWATATLLLWP